VSILIELIVEIVFQLVLQVFAEFVFEVVKAVRESTREAEQLPPAAAGCLLPLVGLFLVGATLGGLSVLFWPQRVFHPGSLKGWSILIGPFCVGGAMHALGRYRESRGHPSTTLATFAGGSCFALGTALARFFGVR